jgi:hypothetical protein
MTNQPVTPTSQPDSQRFITLINFLLVSGMLSSLAFVTNHFIGVFYPEWAITGLPVLTFLLAFESLLVLYVQSRVMRHSVNPFLSVAAEWVLFLLIGKVFLMLQPGAGNFWQEVLSWQNGFLGEFFDLQYLLLIFFLFIIWALTRFFSPLLYQLEEDQALMEQEKLGITFNDRQEARKNLMGLVFVLGFVMIGMTVILKSNFESLPAVETSTRTFAVALLAYFALAFIFLALNQYAIQKARWYFNDINVNPDLAKRWLVYTVVFVAVVILLTVFLPTDFTLGLLPVVQALYNAVIFIFGLFQVFLLFPISLIITFLSNLLGLQQSEQPPTPPEVPEFTPEALQTTGPLPWWDLVKSILFWLVFIGVIVLAIRYYINNHQGLKAFFSRIRLKAWLLDFWKWFKRGLKKVGEAASETVQKGVQQVRKYFAEREVRLPSLKDLIRHLPPRQAVILTYLDWVHWNEKYGLKRGKSQTPFEYAEAINRRWPDLHDDLTPFTEDFIAARYTSQTIDRDRLDEAQSLLAAMKTYILEQQSPQVEQVD